MCSSFETDCTSNVWSTPYFSALAASHTSSYECLVTPTPSSSAIARRTLRAKSAGSATSSGVGVYSGRYVTRSRL